MNSKKLSSIYQKQNTNQCVFDIDSNDQLHNITLMRSLADNCLQDKSIDVYIGKAVNILFKIIKIYAQTHKMNYNKYIESILHINDKSSAGQVNPSDVYEVKQHGNLRERMTLICNFMKQGCEVLIWFLSCFETKNDTYIQHLKYFINEENAKKKIKRIQNIIGLPVSNVNNIMLNFKHCYKSSCSFATIANEATQLSRNLENIHKNAIPLRMVKRQDNSNFQKYTIQEKNVNPPLSIREKRFMNLDNNDMSSDRKLPWVSGQMYWNVLPLNIYISIALYYKEISVSGPSGHTDLILSFLSLLHIFDLKKSVLACIAYMCNPPDHSPHEILHSSNPFGLNYDVTKMSSFDFVNQMLLQQQNDNSINNISRIKSKSLKISKEKKYPYPNSFSISL